jgi:antitoxin YefM
VTIIPVDEAKRNLERVIEQVMNDAEPTVVRTEGGDEVVLLSRDEFDSWNETVYLLSTPANAAHLRKSMEELNQGKIAEKDLIEA